VNGGDGDSGSRVIVLGKISAPFGVRGWSKVTSFTEPPEGILEYKKVQRDQLPESKDEYYWADLIGLEVVTTKDVNLGLVDSLMETGANDVLVVKGDSERLVPWIADEVIVKVDLESRIITVDWDPH